MITQNFQVGDLVQFKWGSSIQYGRVCSHGPLTPTGGRFIRLQITSQDPRINGRVVERIGATNEAFADIDYPRIGRGAE